jgi:triosephosphate isomerase
MADQRRPLIAGNWKMNLTHHEAAGYLESLRGELGRVSNCGAACEHV